MPRVEQTWPGEAANVGEARRFVCRTLNGWGAGDLEWAAAALVSELATNAVLHAGTTFAVALTLDDERLRLEVTDGSTTQPVVRHYDDHATTGRGLRLVVQLSEQWGVEPQRTSKTVWCVLMLDSPTRGIGDDSEVDVDAFLSQFDDGESPDPDIARASRRTSGSFAA